MSERTSWRAVVAFSEDSFWVESTCVRGWVCLMSACTDIIVCVCVCAVSHACVIACTSVWVCACRARPEAMWEVGDACCSAEVWTLTSKLPLYVMYSPVNRVDTVTQRPCGFVLLYLPSKMAVIGSWNCSWNFDFLFSLNWKLEGLLYL